MHYDQYSRVSSVDYPTGLSLTEMQRDGLGRVNGVTYDVNATTMSDEVTYSVSGNILEGTENGIEKEYTYDTAGRLTQAAIGEDNFDYSFGTPDSSCSSLAGNNTNTAKNSNRTSYTLNSQTTTYCYDMADRLLASSDERFTDVTYDDHGNTTSLGDVDHRTELGYDSSDRNTSISEAYVGETEKEVNYTRDVSDRLLRRTYKIDGATTSDTFYGYTSAADSPNFVVDGAGTVVQKYLTLPGGVNVTIKPLHTSAGAVTYSLSNLHGDTMATVDADGLPTLQAPTGPYGELLDTPPANTVDGASFAHMGRFKKTTDAEFAIAPTQMGARVYTAELGRFLQVDPEEGGTNNSYVYVVDPVNESDLNGKWGLGDLFKAARFIVKSVVRSVKKVVVATVKKVVKATVAVVHTAKFYVSTAVSYAAKKVSQAARSVVKTVKKAAHSASKGVAKWAKEKGDAASLIMGVAAVGVCAATAGVGCVVMAGAAIATAAASAYGQSYAKRGSLKRASAQASGSIGLDLVTAGLASKAGAALRAGRVGEAAVNMNGVPASFLGGMGLEAVIDEVCDNYSLGLC